MPPLLCDSPKACVYRISPCFPTFVVDRWQSYLGTHCLKSHFVQSLLDAFILLMPLLPLTDYLKVMENLPLPDTDIFLRAMTAKATLLPLAQSPNITLATFLWPWYSYGLRKYDHGNIPVLLKKKINKWEALLWWSKIKMKFQVLKNPLQSSLTFCIFSSQSSHYLCEQDSSALWSSAEVASC